MYTNEERIARMHGRASEIRIERRARKVRIAQFVSAGASLAAVIVLAIFMPQLAAFDLNESGAPIVDMNASIFGDSSALGYVFVSIVAFLLGATVTAFCFCLKRWQKRKDQEEAQ